ncbi:MAG: amidohydrolase/deacetylase family metallohydrolase, partial [Actinobacteria bacterium]|nr:amidohydrolase/deacetylase family metallohydrolase [Actinomycetota bacterium]
VKARLNADTVGGLAAEALAAAVELGARVGLPLMVDVYDPPPKVEDILARLRPGDLLTHCFVPAGNRLAATPERVELVRAAQQRGVLLDVGHGMGSFSFTDAEALLGVGIEPDTISSDLHTGCLHGPAYDLPTVMSKLVAVGMPLERVLAAATITPRRVIGQPIDGEWPADASIADVAVLRAGSPCDFDDVSGAVRSGARLASSLTLRAGVITHLHPRLPVRRARHYQGRDDRQQ